MPCTSVIFTISRFQSDDLPAIPHEEQVVPREVRTDREAMHRPFCFSITALLYTACVLTVVVSYFEQVPEEPASNGIFPELTQQQREKRTSFQTECKCPVCLFL